MSTAARPTFHAAIGHRSSGGIVSRAASAKDQAAHTVMKYRQLGQASVSEMSQKDLRSDLEQQQKLAIIEDRKGQSNFVANMVNDSLLNRPKLLKSQPEHVDLETVKNKYDDADAVGGDEVDDYFDESSGDDDDDEELELQRELERIKSERAATQAKKEAEEKELADKVNRENALSSNPLVDLTGGGESAKIKRRWNDDVVFRNQARDEPEHKKRFINDTIRSDFHKSFLKKYMK